MQFEVRSKLTFDNNILLLLNFHHKGKKVAASFIRIVFVSLWNLNRVVAWHDHGARHITAGES